MKIYEAKTFDDFLRNYLKSLPNRGHGALRSISLATGIHSTTLSQAVKGGRPFSLEQVASICEYLGLSEHETKYALLLLQAERAGTEVLRKIFLNELKALKQQTLELVHQSKRNKVLSQEENAIFYSNWYYTALAVLSSIPELQNPTALSDRMGLSKQVTNQAINFLVKAGICTNKKGKIEPSFKSTHLESGSPFIARHHSNWRIKAMEMHPQMEQSLELAYTSPMTLSKEDAHKVRLLIMDLIKKIIEVRDPSPCEEAYFLNIDWIKF